MKKALFILAFTLFINSAQASTFTDDKTIDNALKIVKSIGFNDVFNRLEKNKTRVIFYDLSLIDMSYYKHYAISTTDNNGNNYILINSRLKNYPIELISCLIVHESVHELPKADLKEEIEATTREIMAFNTLKSKITYKDNDLDLLTRLNRLSVALKYNQVKEIIENNSFYKQQLAGL